MTRTKRIAGSTAVAALMACVWAAYAAPPASTPPRQDSGEVTVDCDYDAVDGNAEARVTMSPTILWPPNGALVPVTFTLSGDSGCLQVTSVASSQGSAAKYSSDVVCDGAGQGEEDPPGPASVTVWLTAERLGGDKAGNTFTIGLKCGEDNTQLNGLTVTVPHDRRP